MSWLELMFSPLAIRHKLLCTAITFCHKQLPTLFDPY